jgi:hypothetical protein
MPHGHWATGWSLNPGTYHVLHRGGRYRVVKPFRDFYGDEHPIGEAWFFLGYNFLPYEDGLSLFVSIDGRQEWHIRMQCTPEAQGPIVDSLDRHLVPDVG